MTVILEIRERIKNLYAKCDVYINPLLKFILAFIVFTILNNNIGYMTKLNSLPLVLVLALICAILPINGMIMIAGCFTLAHLYALSIEVALTAVVIFALVLLMYFRFSPKYGVYVLLTPLGCRFQIGALVPVSAGLLGEISSVFAVAFGTFIYYFLDGVKLNSSVLGETGEKAALNSKFAAVFHQLLGNKEMYLAIFCFVVVTVTVYLIRRLSMDYSWTIAIVTGALLQFVIMFAGYVMLGIKGKILFLLVETIASLVLGFLLEFLFFNVDYSRVERVQFEDDEYYYYVKAVPKISVTEAEKQVKTIHAPEREEKVVRRRMDEDAIRKKISDEMDIDEELLK